MNREFARRHKSHGMRAALSIVGLWLAGPADAMGFEALPLPGGDYAYRVILDENNAPWVSGFHDVYRWDRAGERFETVGIGDGGDECRAGSLASDGKGSVWVASCANAPFVYRIDNDDALDFHTVLTPNSLNTFGMAADFDGQVWTFGFYDGGATVIDVATEEPMPVLDECGGPCLSLPYVRGDITGLQHHNAARTTGSWSSLWTGCAGEETEWRRVSLDADRPAGSKALVAVRSAESALALASAPFVPVPEDGTSLGYGLAAAGIDGALLEVRVTLVTSEADVPPVLEGAQVWWSCPSWLE